MGKRAKPEEIIAKLREVEVRLSQGETAMPKMMHPEIPITHAPDPSLSSSWATNTISVPTHQISHENTFALVSCCHRSISRINRTETSVMNRSQLSAFIRRYAETGADQVNPEWDAFTTCRHTDRIVDAASAIAFGIGVKCPPETRNEWCSEDGRYKLLALADAINDL